MKKFFLVVSLAACATEADVSESAQEVEVANGVSLNGVSLNGVSLNGVSLNGVSLNGVSLNGVSLNGVSLNGTSLSGRRSDTNQTLAVNAIGPVMSAQLSNGATLPVKVTATTALANGQTSYTMSYQSDNGWKPLCGVDTRGVQIGAIAVPGTWNTDKGTTQGGMYSPSSSSLTLACRGKTIAKCVELGYVVAHGRQRELETCVRLLRGDYCGDGTPFTLDGQTLNLFDASGLQADTRYWWPEGEWTPAGARCLYSKYNTRAYDLGLSPPCFQTLRVSSSCGFGFASGATLISELP